MLYYFFSGGHTNYLYKYRLEGQRFWEILA